jgi:hypothetical protein
MVIKPPPFLLAAGLLFWTWYTGFMMAAVLMASMVESSRFFRLRWELSRRDFERIADLCTIVFVGALVYQFAQNRHFPDALVSVLVWMPMLFFALILAQRFSTEGRIPLSALFWSLRRRGRNNQGIDKPPRDRPGVDNPSVNNPSGDRRGEGARELAVHPRPGDRGAGWGRRPAGAPQDPQRADEERHTRELALDALQRGGLLTSSLDVAVLGEERQRADASPPMVAGEHKEEWKRRDGDCPQKPARKSRAGDPERDESWIDDERGSLHAFDPPRIWNSARVAL